jgi:hypothetical protein
MCLGWLSGKAAICSSVPFPIDVCNSDMVCSLISELNVMYYFRLRNDEQKFMQNVMSLECTVQKIFIVLYNTVYSLLPAVWFPSGLLKKTLEEHSESGVSLFTHD